MNILTLNKQSRKLKVRCFKTPNIFILPSVRHKQMTEDEIKYYSKGLDFVEKGKIVLYKYIDFNGGLSLIRNNTFKFAKPESFNDPFDLYEELIDFTKQDEELVNSNLSRIEKRRIKNTSLKKKVKSVKTMWRKQRNNFGISCFSKIFDNILMWSHYSDKHEGLCIGFLVDIGKLIDINILTYSVDYKSKFLPLPFYDKDINKRLKTLGQYFTVKAEFWSYEKEIRLVDFNYYTKYKSEFFNFSNYAEIKEIYFGLKMDSKDKQRIKTLFSGFKTKPLFYDLIQKKRIFEIKRINASA